MMVLTAPIDWRLPAAALAILGAGWALRPRSSALAISVGPAPILILDRGQVDPVRGREWFAQKVSAPTIRLELRPAIEDADDRCPMLPELRDGFLDGETDDCPDPMIEFSGAAPSQRSRRVLEQLVQEIKRSPHLTRLELRGRRFEARVVRRWLIEHGVEAGRIALAPSDGSPIVRFQPVAWDGHPLRYR